jgi:hypothetical protein
VAQVVDAARDGQLDPHTAAARIIETEFRSQEPGVRSQEPGARGESEPPLLAPGS